MMVRILLATYNGETFLPSLLDSLLAQTEQRFEVIASDDGSSDATPQILDAYVAKSPEKIRRHHAPCRFGNAKDHFFYLLQTFQDAPYLMFCDQDDVWHPDKIEKTLRAAQAMDLSRPALVHTDLRVVDQNLSEIAPSFFRFSALPNPEPDFSQLLIQNVVTGCTMLINHTLAALAASAQTPPQMLMHDWWLALLAAACGEIRFLPDATIDYRQHAHNSVGAKNAKSPAYLWKRLQSGAAKAAFLKTTAQAAAFYRAYQAVLPPARAAVCREFAALPAEKKQFRLRFYHTHQLYKAGFFRKAAQILFW